MKKLLSLILVSVLVFTLTGCTKTTTETVTNADGSTTTTTTVEENGKSSTTVETSDEAEEIVEEDVEEVVEEDAVEASEEGDVIVATLIIENATGVDIAELYFSSSDSDDWGSDICDGDVLEDGKSFIFENAFTYSADALMWDIMAVDGNGDSVEFNGCDMSYAADSENILITLAVDDDEDSETGFCAYIE